MAKFHLTNEAVDDLSNIWSYTFDAWSEKQANMYYEMLIDFCREISENPMLLGKIYDKIAEDLYGAKVNKHIVFYRIISSKEIQISRILHGSMDLKNQF